jgi:hypothetical protein
MQKPFGSPIVHLIGLAVIQFNMHTLATVFVLDVKSQALIKIWKDVIMKGFIAALRALDAATDLETAYFVLARAAGHRCMWLDGEQHCSKVLALGISLVAFAAVDMCATMSNMFLSKRYSDHDRRFFWPGVVVHVTSLLCELGIVSGAIIEARVSRLMVAKDDHTQSSGLTAQQNTAYLAISIMLTLMSFIVSLFGVQYLFQAAMRSSRVFIQHVHKRSFASHCISEVSRQSCAPSENNVADKAGDTLAM